MKKSYLLIYGHNQHNIIHSVAGFPLDVAVFSTTKDWVKIIKDWSARYPDDCIIAEMHPQSQKGPQTAYNALLSFKLSVDAW